MKTTILVSLFLVIFSASLIAQPTFDLGLKAGFNNSKVTLNSDQINSESIVKYHLGAFGRFGLRRVYIQPEVYYSAKGGKLEGSILDVASRFDYSSVDVPMLLGIKVAEGENANLRINAGPVFGILTSEKIKGDNILDPKYYKDNYVGFQYGLGIDLFNFTLDARMESGPNNFYNAPDPDLDGKNKTFMISLGIKIL